MADWANAGFEIGEIKIRAPIVQGGMGIGVSLSSLAAAVASEGGVGVLSAAGIGMLHGGNPAKQKQANSDRLKAEILKARSMTRGVLGVNIMVALSEFDDMVKTAMEEGIDIIFAGAGLPLSLPKWLTPGCKTKLVPIVSSARAVNTISKWWREKYQYLPDAFVVEGPMAGGHLGFKPEQIADPAFRLEKLVSEVLSAVKVLETGGQKRIPVIAAGGIFTGADICRFLKLGASAVQMATRFVATQECDADIEFKNAYVNCREEDIEIISSPVGMPGRAIANEFTRRIAAGEKKPYRCPYHCITTCNQERGPYCISLALLNACRGKLDNGFAFIGANGGRVTEITTVKRLVDELCAQYHQALQLGQTTDK